MKLTDMVCDHSIYYLSQETRSAYGATAKGLTLCKTFDNWHQKKYERFWNLLWIVRLARLAAEAVLRFDLRDSDPHPQEIIVFYGADKKDSEMHLSPFLEVKIERSGPQGLSDTGGETDDGADQSNHQPKRQQVLLNLGNILLQLGVKRDVKLGRAPSGPDQMKEYINKHADKTITGVHQKYADAVRSCTRFYGKEKAMGESAFRESFFKLIIEPLKDCESIIDGQEKEGKRLNTKH